MEFVSWLPGRLAQRFGVPINTATAAVKAYAEFFISIKSGSDIITAPNQPIEIAWEEHLLWTRRYAEDCELVAGYFLDHKPGADQLLDTACLLQAA
jgi:hypothetical protein